MPAEEALFDGQRDDEEVLRVWRKHPWTAARAALIVLILSLLVVASLRFLGASLVTSFLVGAWLIMTPVVVGYTWYIWWNGMYILTSQRLIDIDQRQLFHRTVAELPIDMVQDVRFAVRGVSQTVLNFGSVTIETTGGGTSFELEQVTDPQSVQQAILRTAQKSRKDLEKPEQRQTPATTVKARTQLG